MSAVAADAYDVVAYPGKPLPQCHPNRLATLATLFGMQPAPVEGCRVLDVGCGDGGHLLACAFGLPDSQFVGIDRAAAPIQRGQQATAALGLTNLQFQCADLLEFPLDGEPFDYIVAFGFYSWVPATVRDRLLALCRARLAPQGVAYISYNCYPGCYIRRMFWEMLRFHVDGIDDPGAKMEQALAFARGLESAAGHDEDFHDYLGKELKDMTEGRDPRVLYHDDLSEVNEPVYFHQFATHAREHGLQFLAEADFAEMQDWMLPSHLRDLLAELGKENLIAREQYLDFFKLRRFRQTLLCRSEVALNRDLQPQRVQEFLIASPAQPVSTTPSLMPGEVEEFRGLRGLMNLDHPLSKAAFLCLADAWPQAVPYNELLVQARRRLDRDPVARKVAGLAGPVLDEMMLNQVLLSAYLADVVRWQVYQAQWPRALSDRPRLNALATWQLDQGMSALTTLNLGLLPAEEAFDRRVLQLTDSTRSLEEIAAVITAELQTGQKPDGFAGPEQSSVTEKVRRVLEEAARFGLLAA